MYSTETVFKAIAYPETPLANMQLLVGPHFGGLCSSVLWSGSLSKKFWRETADTALSPMRIVSHHQHRLYSSMR